MRFSSRVFLYGPFALVMLVALAAGVYWRLTANAVTAYLDAANGHDIAPGVTLKFANRHIAGFPFRVDAVLDDAQIAVTTSQGPASWKAEHFAVHALTYGPSQAVYEAAGSQTLSWTGLDGQKHVWTFVPALLRASSYRQGTALARFDLVAEAVRSPELNADQFQFHMRRNPQHDKFDIAVNAFGIHLSPLLQAGFGDTISKLSLDASAAPATPLGGLMGGKSDWRASLEAWRGHGGLFTLNTLEADWNNLKAQGSGKLALDAQHRLDGTLTVNLDGVQSLAANLAKLGLIQGPDNGLAPALLMAAQASNAQIQLSADIGFKDGTISVAGEPAGIARPLY
ncbi:MAG TPA: DUF2125 domain-containing protein [Rhizomicrobium sp.]|jgi:hypothetical protein